MALPGALDPVEAFRRALCRYLHDRGAILFSMVEATGQKTVKVDLIALYRRHEAEETGYLRFEHVLQALAECGDPCMERLREMGVEEIEAGPRGGHVVLKVAALRKLKCQFIA